MTLEVRVAKVTDELKREQETTAYSCQPIEGHERELAVAQNAAEILVEERDSEVEALDRIRRLLEGPPGEK
jgi:hypothetical protein